jgi:nucleotide-binding universal stress UspA family protein
MLKVLFVTDGSPFSNRVVAHLVKLHQSNLQADLHVLNVQIPAGTGHARMFVSKSDLDTYYQMEGEQALKEACEQLDKAGIPYAKHIAIGHVAETIANFAKQHQCDQIVMGTHGRGALTHALLGSVATDVIKLSNVPVTLVK